MVFFFPSRPHRLLSGGSDSLSERASSRRGFRAHNMINSHPTDNATPMREHPAPSSLSLSTTMLNSKRKQMGPPKYTTPLPSPAVTIPSSPAIKQPFSHSHVSFPPPPPPSSGPLSSSVATTPHLPGGVSPGPGSVKSRNFYNGSRIADLMKVSRSGEKNFCDYLSFEDGWWQCMELPESIGKMYKMLNPLHLRMGMPPMGSGSGGAGPPLLPLTGLVSPFSGPGDRRMSRLKK